MPPQPPAAPPPARRFSWPLVAALVLGLALLAAYANSFRVPFIFDDDSSISENLTLRSWRTAFLPPGDSGLTVSGRPLLNATLALNHAISGKNVFGYHATNLLIHVLAALTLFGLVRRSLLLPSLREKFSAHADLTALAVSALWALHPLQTESVTYIVQRAESLVGLCYLLTLYGFVRSIDSPPASTRRWQLATFFSCLAGMASKEVMVSAPLIVFLFDRTFVAGSFAQAWHSRRRLHLALASTWILLVLCIVSTGNRGGTVGANELITPWSYFLTQCQALTHYLRLTFWPHPLVFDYGTAVVSRFSDVTGQFFILLLLGLATLWALWRRPRIGFIGTVFFVVLAPSSSFVPVVTQTMAEHRMYLGLAPVICLAVLALHSLLGRAALGVWLCTSLVFGTLTFRRNQDYGDAFNLWTDTRLKVPHNARPLNNLGALSTKGGDHPRALSYYAQAVEINPNDLNSQVGYANCLVETGHVTEAFSLYRRAIELSPRMHEARYNYGKALLEQGQLTEAVTELTAALSLKPSSVDARYNLGNALLATGRPAEAAEHFQQVIDADPDSLDAHNNLGNALVRLGRVPESLGEYEIVLRNSPDNARALLNMGRALTLLGRFEEGGRYFEKSVSVDSRLPESRANLATFLLAGGRPADAIPHYEAAIELGLNDATLHLNLGRALLQSRREAEALVHFRKAIELAPKMVEAHSTFALALLQTGHPEESIPHYQQLLVLAPDSAEACNNLGIAYAQLGRMDDARTYFRQALRLNPNFAQARENLERAAQK